MKRKNTNKRRWALWLTVIILLATTALFSAEEIGKRLGLMMGQTQRSDPFKFGEVSQIPRRHKSGGAGASASANNLLDHVAKRPSRPINSEDVKNNPEWKNRYRVGTERDTIDIQEAILKGSKVKLPPGDYLIDQPLRFRNGLILSGAGVRLIGTAGLAAKGFLLDGVEDLTIRGITFWDISLTIKNSQNITLDNVAFVQKRAEALTKPQIQVLSVTNGFRVHESQFVRSAQAPGMGISVESSEKVYVRYSSFMGAFETALEAVGACEKVKECNLGTKVEPRYDERFQNRQVLFEGNKLHRKNLKKKAGYGIHLWGVQGAKILKNKITGWPMIASSGCIKIGNGEALLVSGNRCDAGLLLEHSRIHPRYLRNVTIENNTIRIRTENIPKGWESKYEQWLPGSPRRTAIDYAGIIARRDFQEDLELTEFMESEISIQANTVKNGLIQISGIRPSALSVDSNVASLCRWVKDLKTGSDNACTIHESR